MKPRRRDLALAAAALACARPAAALAQGTADEAALRRTIDLELRLAAAYEAEEFEQAALFAEQCREHVRALGEALRNRGGRPPEVPAAPARGGPLALESEAVAACHDAIGEVGDTRVLPIFVALMANHGQHLVVLRQRLGRNPIPAAFETGSVQ
jgi:hypothetical protein